VTGGVIGAAHVLSFNGRIPPSWLHFVVHRIRLPLGGLWMKVGSIRFGNVWSETKVAGGCVLTMMWVYGLPFAQ
jgi:hypothetical protein